VISRVAVVSEYNVRPATRDDAEFLVEMLVAAVNWRPDRKLTRAEIMAVPKNAGYVDGWGRPDDVGVVALEPDGTRIGAAWVRFRTADDPGYGYVSDDVPELAIAVVGERRGQGVGRALVPALLDAARDRGIGAVSLSVGHGNYAAKLYSEHGFRVVESLDEDDIMLVELTT
jgi:ribosomal protein S18 acetylase RimI-like enzyme